MCILCIVSSSSHTTADDEVHSSTASAGLQASQHRLALVQPELCLSSSIPSVQQSCRESSTVVWYECNRTPDDLEARSFLASVSQRLKHLGTQSAMGSVEICGRLGDASIERCSRLGNAVIERCSLWEDVVLNNTSCTWSAAWCCDGCHRCGTHCSRCCLHPPLSRGAAWLHPRRKGNPASPCWGTRPWVDAPLDLHRSRHPPPR